MMDIFSMETVLAIVVITYLVGLGAKLCPKVKDNYIPVIVGVAGETIKEDTWYTMVDGKVVNEEKCNEI